jgi:hypothetical protein
MPLHHPTTIAVLGADTVVGSALCALLGGCGYRINPLGAHPTGVVGELLDGADLLLLAPRLEEDARETLLGAIGKGIPVITLRTALERAQPGEGILSVPWPCETGALAERIEAVLAGAPPKGAP